MKYITIFIPPLAALLVFGFLVFVVWLEKFFGGDDNDSGKPGDFWG